MATFKLEKHYRTSQGTVINLQSPATCSILVFLSLRALTDDTQAGLKSPLIQTLSSVPLAPTDRLASHYSYRLVGSLLQTWWWESQKPPGRNSPHPAVPHAGISSVNNSSVIGKKNDTLQQKEKVAPERDQNAVQAKAQGNQQLVVLSQEAFPHNRNQLVRKKPSVKAVQELSIVVGPSCS